MTLAPAAGRPARAAARRRGADAAAGAPPRAWRCTSTPTRRCPSACCADADARQADRLQPAVATRSSSPTAARSCSTCAARGRDGAHELEFVVTDTGIGMDEATHGAAVPAASCRATSSRSRRHGGTGLGPGDLAQPGAPDGRRHHGAQQARRGQHLHLPRCRCVGARAGARRAPTLPAPPTPPARGRCRCWSPRTTRSTASTWRRCSRTLGHDAPLHRQRPGGASTRCSAARRRASTSC